ncbi:MAG: hypothetical protein JNL28_01285 [Planctomycetes bacterium]|nr:hypothetical protein [Planctomycetota bacterium]
MATYADIKTDSPWRWATVFSVLVLWVATLADSLASYDMTSVFYWIAFYCIMAFAVVVIGISWFKVGSPDAVGVVKRHADATGGIRANSHPGLALAMRVAGIVMIAIWIATRFVLGHEHTAERTEVERAIMSFSFSMGAIFLTIFGWQRPWDLKVVERSDCSAKGDRMGASYVDIRPDSPWRWVPLIAMPFAFVAIDLLMRSSLSEEKSSLGWGAFIALFLLVASLLRRFSGAGYDAAVQQERVSGGRRVVTHPGLALGMLAVGILMIASWIVATVARDDLRATPVGWVAHSFAVPAIGVYLALFGLQRPWDLKVVEREPDAAQ